MAYFSIMEGFGPYAPYILILGAVSFLYWLLPTTPVDPREPPMMRSTIPVVGPVVGFLWYKNKYFEILSARYRLPIFTVPIFNTKLAIITSPDVAQSALRAKSLSFDPFSIAFAINVIGLKSKNFKDACIIPADPKEACYTSDMHKIYHEPLQPGPELHQTNKSMLNRIAVFVNEIGSEYSRRDLYEWIKHSFTIATAGSLFGSRNPIANDHSLIDELWNFEAGVQMLMLDFLPSFTAHKAYLGRAKVQAAMKAYYHAGYDLDSDVSPFIKRRTFTQRKYGFSSDDIGSFDIAMLMVATTNAIPTLYWYLVYVFSQPAVVSDIREEVLHTITTTTDGTGRKTMTIDISTFAQQCPLLCSTYQEAQRLANKSMSIRVALDDTTISSADGSFLIKKDTIVFLPSGLQHTAPSIWGPTAASFDPTRFLKRDPTIAPDKDAERLQKKAFFPFGGGKHLCPGRHFAFAEILGFMAAMTTGFEMVMADGPGADPRIAAPAPIRVPESRYRFFGEAVPKPVEKSEVFIRRRPGFEAVRWAFEVGDVEGA